MLQNWIFFQLASYPVGIHTRNFTLFILVYPSCHCQFLSFGVIHLRYVIILVNHGLRSDFGRYFGKWHLDCVPVIYNALQETRMENFLSDIRMSFLFVGSVSGEALGSWWSCNLFMPFALKLLVLESFQKLGTGYFLFFS